ncbi:MAG: metallophosphoesterase [Candidatus Pacebacteria bacterium]|jgi:hypothetical protein|nr:metallophosphoesterase [Candidatus Paceibacterota bacterium]
MKKIVIAIICAAAAAAAFLGYARFEVFWFETAKTTVRRNDLPAAFAGKKIAFVSDLHCGEGFPFERMGEVVDLINSQNPDILLLGGDYGNDMKRCLDKIAMVKASMGKFGILGNHDIENGKERVIQAMIKAGITPLVNENRRIAIGSEAIAVAGTDETWYGIPDGAKAMEGVTEFTIYLTHDPAYLEKYKNDRAKLLLAGHTHGGQMTLFGLSFASFVHGYPYKYEKGIFEEPDRTVIVTNGIGTGIVPLRFFARPQINVIALER